MQTPNDTLTTAFLEAAPDPMMIKSADGTYLYINKAFEQAFGVQRDEVLGKKAEDLWGELHTNLARIADDKVTESGEVTSYEVSFTHADGETRDHLVKKFVIIAADGTFLIGVTYADITNQKQIERRISESEQRYALASLQVGIWDWNLETDEVYVSPAFRRLLGFETTTVAETTATDIRSLYHPDDFPSHKARMNEHLKDPSVLYESVHRLRNVDGTYRWYRAVGHATDASDGKARRVIGMLTDIDDEKRMTEALRVSEARISTLLDNSPTAIYFKDLDLRIVVANRKYLEMYGVPQETVIGKTSEELFGENPGREFMAHDLEVLETRSLITRDEILDGRDLLTSKFPILDSDGELVGVGGIEIDISDQKAVERALKLARDEAETASRAKSAFLANMSHELRTPLNSVIGYSDSLLAGTLGEIENKLHREYIGIISSAGTFLLELINDILDLSRIESGNVELDETEFALLSVITSALALSQDRHAAHALDIRCTVPEALPKVRADQRQISQVIINLLANAIKFTPTDGSVEVSCERREDGGLAIIVADTGIGIAASDIELVKQPFVQVEDSLTRQHEGTGLGLAIINSIAALHDATFELKSELGSGTTATFALPASRVID